MKVNLHPKEGLLINAFMLVFIIHAAQVGVGLVGLPRVVYLEAKHDAWISVFLAGMITSVVLTFMIQMLKQYDSADLYGIHVDIFGKWAGYSLNIIYMIYMTSTFFVILMNYVEIVQVWIFPTLPTWQISLVLILLIIYAVYGGIRVVVGVAFLSVIGTFWLVIVMFIPLQYGDFNHLFPIMNTNVKQLLRGAQSTTLSMLGYELILFVYPFVKEKHKAMFFVQIGNLITTIVFTLATLVCIVFFASNSLEKTIWPVLSMFKIVRLPNLERFEFIAVSFWMLIILPNMCFYVWAASKGFSRILRKKQKWGIWIIGIAAYGATFFIKSRYQMNTVTDLIAKAGFYFAFCYPVLLAIIVFIKKWFKGRESKHAETS
ncbi:spore germination protein (amino acid permease) [Neobacillus niacini]|uniref:GerAB/ArcD/ProY family transporter n=1 Tax=Neobacillus niacini TaxID=86668 RepID=UPI002789BD96|nr:GerAB/ArcD/ProY family transporter [Neobacillus niacini]MDQ1001888.1 spore germination protein (amino acid permease) [Neobacillus niacini]